MEINKKVLDDTIKGIWSAFVWDNSEEGFDFWDDVASKLYAISQNGTPEDD